MSSVTKEFLEDRLDGNAAETIGTGAWYSGFDRVSKFASENHLPFFGIWSNGDACYYCRELEKVLMTSMFKEWMKTSGIVFYFGCSLDKSADDKIHGTAYNWTWDNKTVKAYPMCRFYYTDGDKTVNSSNSGNKWRDNKTGDSGAAAVIEKLTALIEQTKPSEKTLKIRTNPEWSAEQVAEFREEIKANGGYCPCSPEQSADTKCMCKWFREQKTEGHCHCGLYDKYYA